MPASPDLGPDALRALIEKEIAKTERRIAEYKGMSGPVSPDDAIGRVSRMDAINNKSVTESALRQAEAKLAGLQTALGRVGQPDFGRCKRCGEAIPAGRLVLKPESPYCVRCAR
jgi:DnaK suppressor protein